MPTMVVLAMHGAPPTDFPRADLGEYTHLHSTLEAHYPGQKMHRGAAVGELSSEDVARYEELDERIRNWPRNELNDPFYAGAMALAAALEKECHAPVIVGFNEFCTPSLAEALQQAAQAGARRVVVITPMMTSGGAHSEVDIPAAIREAEEQFKETEFIYAWPFSHRQVASFLSNQVSKYLSDKLEPIGWR